MTAIVAQVKAHATPATPVKLFEASAGSVVNVFCVNPGSSAAAVSVEVRPGDAAQVDQHRLVAGVSVASGDRLLEGPVYLAAGDAVYVYGGSADLVFHCYGQTL